MSSAASSATPATESATTVGASPTASSTTAPLDRTLAASGISPVGSSGLLPVGIGIALLAALGAGTAYAIRRRRA